MNLLSKPDFLRLLAIDTALFFSPSFMPSSLPFTLSSLRANISK